VRVAFFILIAANLLFLAWAKWVDAPGQASRPEPPSHLPRLKLVSEQPAAKRATETTDAAAHKTAMQSADTPTQAQTSCMSVGPFNDLTTAARVAAALRDRGFTPQQRAEEGEILEGYWVYLEGMKSDGDVTRVLHNLERKGFKDAHVMREAAEGRRISVGLFSDRDRAQERANAIRKTGLEPLIAERKFPGTVYWVDVALRPGISTLPTEGLLADGGQVQIGTRACPPVPGAQPAGPVVAPADSGQDKAIGNPLPVTTVASAPKAQ